MFDGNGKVYWEMGPRVGVIYRDNLCHAQVHDINLKLYGLKQTELEGYRIVRMRSLDAGI
jgi:hypothetical protein